MADGLRVLYLIDSLSVGGAERSLVDMAPHLLEEGVDLRVAVLHDRPGLQPELEALGVPVVVAGGHSRAAWLLHVAALLRRERPQLLHTTLFESDVVGRSAAAITRTPVVSTIANTSYGSEHAAEAGIRPRRLRAAQLADAATARAVRRFHAVSRASADTGIERLRLRSDRVEVIPRGRSLERLGPPSPNRRAQTRAALGIADAAPVALAVARQEPQKGLDILLRALPAVLDRSPGTQLLIAGAEGRSTPELRAIVEQGGLAPAVRFLGRRDDVADLLCAADIFVLSSRREGLPGAVLEAMAMETPVVAFSLANVVEAVPDEEHAFLVAEGDGAALAAAMSRALADPAGRAARARLARARFAECFDIVSVSRRMRQFYEAAIRR